MFFRKMLLVGALATLAVAPTAARAAVLTGVFDITVLTGTTGNGTGFSTVPGNPFVGGTATAHFTYTGALNFSNTAGQNSGSTGDINGAFFTNPLSITGYTGSGIFAPGNDNYNTVNGFLAGSGSASSFAYGSLYTIKLGSLSAGTVLTITHDDGATVFQGNTQFGPTASGPTSVVTDVVTITSTGDTTLYYSRQNGTPSILQVSAVPEPSTWAMMILGFIGVGFMAYRRKQSGPAFRTV